MLCLFIVTRRIPHQPHLAQRRSQPFHRCRTSRPILQYLRELARGAIRVVVEDVMREELDALIGVGWGESSPKRKGYRNGFYRRDLVTSSGRLEDLQVPRDREGHFHTQVFDRYSRYERATRKSFRLAVSAASPQGDLLVHQEYPTGTCGGGNATV
jgi:hypothetical protein